MLKRLVLVPSTLLLVACAGNDGTDAPGARAVTAPPADTTEDTSEAPPIDDSLAEAEAEADDLIPEEDVPEPLAEFEAGDHLLRIYDVAEDGLLIAERAEPGDASVLEDAPAYESVAELYSHFVEGDVPAVAAHDRRWASAHDIRWAS